MRHALTLDLSLEEMLELHVCVWKRIEDLKIEASTHPNETVRMIATRQMGRLAPVVSQIEQLVTAEVRKRG